MPLGRLTGPRHPNEGPPGTRSRPVEKGWELSLLSCERLATWSFFPSAFADVDPPGLCLAQLQGRERYVDFSDEKSRLKRESDLAKIKWLAQGRAQSKIKRPRSLR